MTAAGGTLQPRRPEPGWQLSGPPLPLALTVLAWLGTGTALAGLNKWIFAAHGFRYPLLLSSLHMLAAVALGYPLGWARGPLPSVRPRARIYLLSLTFCGSVALGNLGLSLVPLDAAQAVHATAPLATLLLSALLRGRRHHPLQYAAMGPVCAGAACSIAGGVHFHQPGGCVLLAATVLRALKSLQQSKCRPRAPGVSPCWWQCCAQEVPPAPRPLWRSGPLCHPRYQCHRCFWGWGCPCHCPLPWLGDTRVSAHPSVTTLSLLPPQCHPHPLASCPGGCPAILARGDPGLLARSKLVGVPAVAHRPAPGTLRGGGSACGWHRGTHTAPLCPCPLPMGWPGPQPRQIPLPSGIVPVHRVASSPHGAPGCCGSSGATRAAMSLAAAERSRLAPSSLVFRLGRERFLRRGGRSL